MAKQEEKPVVTEQTPVIQNGVPKPATLQLYRCYRKKKKTAKDESGWELMTITRATDEADAFSIARQMYEMEHGIPVRVEAVSQ